MVYISLFVDINQRGAMRYVSYIVHSVLQSNNLCYKPVDALSLYQGCSR